MNCKQGDIAVIVSSFAGNEGKIVQCLRLATDMERARAAFGNYYFSGPAWVLDRLLLTVRGDYWPLAHDAALRPIRDNPGADETLTWAGLPKPMTQPKETA